MSDKEKTLIVLQLASQTCSAALKVLGDSNATVRPADVGGNASLDTRLKDFTSLLSLLYQNTTKLAIVLKPSSPTYLAAISPAKDLAAHIDALASCACSLDKAEHGGALVREVRWAAEEVVSALGSLLVVYAENAQTTRSGGEGGAREAYLIKTGAVHEAIDRSRRISHSNREAVNKRWEGVLGGMDDCVSEVQEMVVDEQGSTNEVEGEGEGSGYSDDGGWGELDDTPSLRKDSVKTTEEEMERLKFTHHLLKFTHALLKRVSSVLLGASSIFASPSPSTLDSLLSRSDVLLKSADDLVNALYIPQDPKTVSKGLQSFTTAVNELYGITSSLGLTHGSGDDVADLTRQAVSLKLNELPDDRGTQVAKERKWFNSCFLQISKFTKAVEMVHQRSDTDAKKSERLYS